RTRSCTGRSVTSSPNSRTLPVVGGKSPVIALNSVVLPAPLEPRTARRSPALTVRLMSARATSAPKWRLTASSSRAFRPAPCSRDSASDLDNAMNALLAARVLAPDLAVGEELLVGQPERLAHLRNDLDGLVQQVAVRTLDDLGQEHVGNGVSTFVELDHPGGRLEFKIRQHLAVLRAAVGQVSADFVEGDKRRLRVDVVGMGEQRRR